MASRPRTGVSFSLAWLCLLVITWSLVLRSSIAGADTPATEVQRLLDDIDQIVSHERRQGSEVDFLLWTHGEAITLVSMEWIARGTRPGNRLTRADLERAVKPVSLEAFIGTHERYIQLRLKRTRDSWRRLTLSSATPNDHPPYPAEGRSIPISFTMSHQARTIRRGVADVVSGLSRMTRVPVGGESMHQLAVVFDDERVYSWTPVSYAAIRDDKHGRMVAVDASSFRALADTLMPFAKGLGLRKVEISLKGAHRSGTTAARWDVVMARVARAKKTPDEFADVVRDYRRTHEQIMVDWQTGIRDVAIQAAGLTLEQVALWLVGGWLFKVAGAGIRSLAPKLTGILRGASRTSKRGASEYMETLLTRLPGKDKQAVKLLMARAETQGMKALSGAEQAQLQSMMRRLETMVGSPLTKREKGRLRTAMHNRFNAAYPKVYQVFDRAGINRQTHHRIPLEWAHKLPKLDINGPKNLIAVPAEVHQNINSIWIRFRTANAGQVTKAHIERVAGIVDRHFKHWYNKPPTKPGWEAASKSAKHKALGEVDAFLAQISRATR